MSTKTSRPMAPRTDVLRGVDWESYPKLRNHPGNDHLRLSYLGGTLIVVSPQFLHDRYAWRIAKVVDEVGEALNLPTQCTVSTTLQHQGPGPRKGSAKEPDFGFYWRARTLALQGPKEVALVRPMGGRSLRDDRSQSQHSPVDSGSRSDRPGEDGRDRRVGGQTLAQRMGADLA